MAHIVRGVLYSVVAKRRQAQQQQHGGEGVYAKRDPIVAQNAYLMLHGRLGEGDASCLCKAPLKLCQDISRGPVACHIARRVGTGVWGRRAGEGSGEGRRGEGREGGGGVYSVCAWP